MNAARGVTPVDSEKIFLLDFFRAAIFRKLVARETT